jgi:hypothetical protein
MRHCHENSDCNNLGTCLLNSGTTSLQCTTGICGLEEGDEGVEATFLANVAGPFSTRLAAIGNKSNGTKTIILDTYPSLYLVGSLIQFGGTEGALVGEVSDAAEYAAGASEGASNPADGSLVIIDEALGVVRAFDLRSGAIIPGAFGSSDSFVTDPRALAFRPDNGRLYVAEASGAVFMFDGSTGVLISTFGNVGASPVSMRFSPVSGDLLDVNGDPGSGVLAFGSDGTAKGVLGETGTATGEPVDIDFLGEPENHALLIADRTGKVVRCDADGTDCSQFSAEADDLLGDGSPSAIAVNPSAEDTDADVLIADPVGKRVIACNSDGDNCATFGDTGDPAHCSNNTKVPCHEDADCEDKTDPENLGTCLPLESAYQDVFFAPSSTPTTTSTTTTTTLD